MVHENTNNHPDINKTPPGSELAPAAALEGLREHMATAPIHLSDSEALRAHTTSYSFSQWPANPEEKGRVIATEVAPEIEVLLPGGGRDYDEETSVAVEAYMEAGILASAMDGKLGNALRHLGFEGQKSTLGQATTLAISYPGKDTLNTTLAKTGNTDIRVELLDSTDFSARKIVTSYAEGKILYTSETELYTNAPVWSLLPPEFHDSLKQKAQAAIAAEDPGEMRRVFNAITGMNLRLIEGALGDAIVDSEESGTHPSRVDELGYRFNVMLGGEGGLPDQGRSLAERTVQHIKNLESSPLEIQSTVKSGLPIKV